MDINIDARPYCKGFSVAECRVVRSNEHIKLENEDKQRLDWIVKTGKFTCAVLVENSICATTFSTGTRSSWPLSTSSDRSGI